MPINKVGYRGWSNNLRLSNQHVEAIVTLDVGPRIISYKTPAGPNVLKNYDEQMGSAGEDQWMIRGGHRIWLAPEDEQLSYLLDNSPVAHAIEGESLRVSNPPVAPWNVKKEMLITLAPDSPELTIVHTATNAGSAPIAVATWALSVMAPGGIEIIPAPPLGEHPRDLLPTRLLVVWPFTDLSDPRLHMGSKFITLRQMDRKPIKLGLNHTERWVAYLLEHQLFIKTFDHAADVVYPDFGCNFETFSNHEMLEVESLGPLQTLSPGQSVSHTEKWYLFGDAGTPPLNSDDALADWIAPFLAKVP